MIRPDQINFLSTLPNYINIGNTPGSIVITGSIADGFSATFSTTIATSRQNNRFDVYGTNQNTNTKQLLSNTSFPVIYQRTSTEAVNSIITYGVASIQVDILVENFTGGPITLVNQTIAISVVQYEIPY